jgi:hypothetical protein
VQSKYDVNQRSQKAFGSVGIKGFFYFLYTCLSIGAMIRLNTSLSVAFGTQLIAQSILLFFLGLGIYFALTASQKISDVISVH